MPLNKDDVAQKLWETVRNSPKESITQQIKTYAEAFVSCLTAGSVSFAPGTITGTGIPSVNGSPVTGPGTTTAMLTGAGGLMTLSASIMNDTIKADPGYNSIGPQVLAENTALITYVMTGLISFPLQDCGVNTGTIVTSTPPVIVPGTLLNGMASNGTVSGLTGSACLAAVLPSTGVLGPKQLDFYSALMDYVVANLEVTFNPGSITGTFPAPDVSVFTLTAATGGVIK